MAIGRIAGPLSITVSLALIAAVAALIILAAIERGAKPANPAPRMIAATAVRPPAPKAPPVPKAPPSPKDKYDNAPTYPVGPIRLPPPPPEKLIAKATAKPASAAVRTAKAVTRPPIVKPAAKRLVVTPLSPAKPASKPKPLRKPPPRMALRVRKTPKAPPAKPKPRPMAPAAVAKPAPPLADGSRIRKAGRVLLKLREHGKGPTVEIAWPDTGAARRRLYRRLVRCYGMRAAVLDGQDRLFAPTGPAGSPWNIDLDRFSGFLRSPAGQPIPEESRVFATIAARHQLQNWRPVRIFPRNVDAVLLGGLQHIVGGRYGSARLITAAYISRGSRLILGSVRVDGRALPGAVDLTGTAKFTCRRAGG